MNQDDTLTSKALLLKEAGKSIVKAIVNYDSEEAQAAIDSYNTLKKEIKTVMLDVGVAALPGGQNEEARDILHKIATGQPVGVETAIQNGELSGLLSGTLEDEELEQLGSDLFYSWMSHYDYIEGLYKIGALVLSTGKVPKMLSEFVREARDCFALQQYTAVIALCRTMLELSLKDVAKSSGLFSEDRANIRDFETRREDLMFLIDKVCENKGYRRLQDELHRARKQGNKIVHGTHGATSAAAEIYLKETLNIIHRLY